MDEVGRGARAVPAGVPDLSVALWGAVFVAAALGAGLGFAGPSDERFPSRGFLICMAVAGCFAAIIGVVLLTRPQLMHRFARYLARTTPHPHWQAVVILWLGVVYVAIFAVQLAVPVGSVVGAVLLLAAIASSCLVQLLPRLRDALARRRAVRS